MSANLKAVFDISLRIDLDIKNMVHHTNVAPVSKNIYCEIIL